MEIFCVGVRNNKLRRISILEVLQDAQSLVGRERSTHSLQVQENEVKLHRVNVGRLLDVRALLYVVVIFFKQPLIRKGLIVDNKNSAAGPDVGLGQLLATVERHGCIVVMK